MLGLLGLVGKIVTLDTISNLQNIMLMSTKYISKVAKKLYIFITDHFLENLLVSECRVDTRYTHGYSMKAQII